MVLVLVQAEGYTNSVVVVKVIVMEAALLLLALGKSFLWKLLFNVDTLYFTVT